MEKKVGQQDAMGLGVVGFMGRKNRRKKRENIVGEESLMVRLCECVGEKKEIKENGGEIEERKREKMGEEREK